MGRVSEWRGITVRQPWAWCIAHAGKTVENRSAGALGWRYRGPIFIHAAKLPAAAPAAGRLAACGIPTTVTVRRGRQVLDTIDHPAAGGPGSPTSPWLRSSVVALADLADIHEASGCCEPWGEDSYLAASEIGRVTHVAHLVLDDIVPLPEPITDVAGALGLWRPDLELARRLDAAIAAHPGWPNPEGEP